MGYIDNGARTDVKSVAETMKAQAQEIERLHMELQRTSLKQKEDILDLTSGSLEEFVQEERVTQWMRLCVGALSDNSGSGEGGGSIGCALAGYSPLSPSGLAPAPELPALSSLGADGRDGTRPAKRPVLGFKAGGRPSGGRCHASIDARGSHAGGGGCCSGGGRASCRRVRCG